MFLWHHLIMFGAFRQALEQRSPGNRVCRVWHDLKPNTLRDICHNREPNLMYQLPHDWAAAAANLAFLLAARAVSVSSIFLYFSLSLSDCSGSLWE